MLVSNKRKTGFAMWAVCFVLPFLFWIETKQKVAVSMLWHCVVIGG
jgi:hypothetical protein